MNLGGKHWLWKPGKKRNDPAGKERAAVEAITSEHEALTEGIELAVSRFRPHLPGEINAAAVERWLLDGPVVFFRDAELGKFVVQPFKAMTDELDVYGVPITRETWNGYNSYTALLDDENSVIIHDNLTDEPLILKLEYYAKMLGKIDEILKQNVRKQRTPTFINADRDNLLSALNVSDLTDCGVDWIYQRNADYEKDLTAVTPMAPFVADRLALLAAEIRARRDALLAVDDISSPKKERLTAGEVDAAQGYGRSNGASAFMAREMAAEKINKMFALWLPEPVRWDVAGSAVYDRAEARTLGTEGEE